MIEYLIVGIDPGTTLGIAILDLNGNLKSIFSSKNLQRRDVIDKISKFGYPSVISTDVNPPPKMVEKFSKSFDAVLHVPDSNLSVSEKNELCREYEVKNSHERDALSAALKAYNNFLSKFENIDARLREFELESLSLEVKNLILKGKSLTGALKILMETPKEEKIKERKVQAPEVLKLERKILELGLRLSEMREREGELREKIRAYEISIEDLRIREKMRDEDLRREILREGIFEIKESEIKRLKKELKIERKKLGILERENKILKRMRILEYSERALPLKVLNNFSKEEIKKFDERFGIKVGDIIFLKNASGGGALAVLEFAEKRVRAVIHEGKMSHMALKEFERRGIPLFSAEEVEIEMTEDVGIVDRASFEEKLKQWRFRKELREAERKSKMLEEVLEEYREERSKD